MGKVSSMYPSLVQGMSKQPDVDRNPAHAEDQLNMYCNPINGLTDRMPLEAIAQLDTAYTGGDTWHHYRRGDDEQYIIRVTDDTVNVWDFEGNVKQVTAPDGYDYLTGVNEDRFNVTTIGDYTMITNTETVVQSTPEKNQTPESLGIAHVWIRRGSHGKLYGVTIVVTSPDGTSEQYLVEYETPLNITTPSTGETNSDAIDITAIAKELQVAIAAAIPNIYATTQGETIIIVPDVGYTLHVSAQGAGDNDDIVAASTTVRKIEHLPPSYVNGQIKQVTRDEDGEDSFWMEFVSEEPLAAEAGADTRSILDDMPGDDVVNIVAEESPSGQFTGYSGITVPPIGSADSALIDGASGDTYVMVSSYDVKSSSVEGDYDFIFAVSVHTNPINRESVAQVIVANGRTYDVQDAEFTNDGVTFTWKWFSKPAGFRDGGEHAIDIFHSREDPNIPAKAGTTTSEGRWIETKDPRVVDGMDATTMPHRLVRLPDGTFQFGPHVYEDVQGVTLEGWDIRKVGDDDTNELPRFVGGTITELGFYRDRLVIAAGEYIHFSKASLYWDLFVGSIIQEADDDGFDTAAIGNEVNEITSLLYMNTDLYTFSANAQFRMFGEEVLKPGATLDRVTSFTTDTAVKPIGVGNRIYFADKAGDYSTIHEFYVDSLANTNNSIDVTAHVSNLVAGDVHQLIGSSQDGLIAIIPKAGDNRMYIYQVLWDGDQRTQACWGYWELPQDMRIEYGFIYNTILYVTGVTADDTLRLCTFDLEDKVPTGMPYNPRLDFRTTEVVLSGEVLHYPHHTEDTVYIMGPDTDYPGMRAYVDTVVGTTITFKEDIYGTVYAGVPYRMEYVPTRPFVRDPNTGRPYIFEGLRIGHIHMQVTDTADTYVKLKSPYYDTFEIPITGRVTGNILNKVGQASLYSGEFLAQVGMAAGEYTFSITKHSHKPFRMNSLGWVGSYTQRSRYL